MWKMPDPECPHCGMALAILGLQGVEIDVCLECGGVWLDAGELERIGELAGCSAATMSRVFDMAGRGALTSRRCPRCLRRMGEKRVGGESPVAVEACPSGHGIWLDAGEMQKLVGAAASGDAAGVAAFLEDALGHWVNDER